MYLGSPDVYIANPTHSEAIRNVALRTGIQPDTAGLRRIQLIGRAYISITLLCLAGGCTLLFTTANMWWGVSIIGIGILLTLGFFGINQSLSQRLLNSRRQQLRRQTTELEAKGHIILLPGWMSQRLHDLISEDTPATYIKYVYRITPDIYRMFQEMVLADHDRILDTEGNRERIVPFLGTIAEAVRSSFAAREQMCFTALEQLREAVATEQKR